MLQKIQYALFKDFFSIVTGETKTGNGVLYWQDFFITAANTRSPR